MDVYGSIFNNLYPVTAYTNPYNLVESKGVPMMAPPKLTIQPDE